ncbi:GNAT family N-acetyltransferase [Actinotalea sp. BY-33]|uniref:GNAT family N-acetyltransferase n=1 Tax=Actinotalea soli TaxID=2819234 RepID=A0A939LT28_9CELL|nr:GNAT family N-acetyltransferase [Actinotalea soli]MBO1750827.1 GNAT family N-acetyltransferase [Actinotalea soli]
MTAIAVRPAVREDAEAIALAHVRAWQGAYQGLIDQEHLDRLDPERYTAGWRRMLGELAGPAPASTDPRGSTSARQVVGLMDGRVVGFAGYGPCRDEDGPGLGELYAINLHPEAWGRGVGTALLARVTLDLARAGLVSARLWVLPGNHRARRFYEARGWSCTEATREAEVNGVTVPEVAYERSLADALPVGETAPDGP